MIAYPAMLDVPRELVRHLARLLAAERRARGTRTGTRALTCFYQALLVLVWFRKAEDLNLLGASFGVSRATAYRYRDEGVAVLAAQAQDLHTALRRVAAEGWTHVILDGNLFDCDRLTETTLSVKGETIDAGIPASTATSVRTFKRSCDRMDCRSGRPRRCRVICTTPAAPANSGSPPRSTGPPPNSVSRPWLTPATKAQVTASKHRLSNPLTVASWHPTTVPTTDSCGACGGKANAASRS
ncbi:hypothetical protein Asi03nite_35170 [Actinoplanes siamensis]|uniref:Transposase Helix-turn-helix domain-containing protein n=1 Tax=Actinoplanes siamensis TaxID=1223317 RepID=A0A919TL47_9ACTN|nr:hypothetical protein Asi03nite_35170 [Actinoplanes siamensis]